MKKHIQYLKYLIAAIALFILASLSERNPVLPENYQIDTEKFSKILYDKEAVLTIILDSTLENSRELIGKKNLNLFEYLPNINFEELKNQGFIVLVYIEDSLRFWSDNSIELSLNQENSKLNNTVVNLNNAWYYVKNLHEKKLDVFGLILIKSDYSYENQYLKNKFQDAFDLPETIQISKVPLSYGFDIYDSSKNYSFTLFPTKKIDPSSENWKYTGLIFFIAFAFLLLFFEKFSWFICLYSKNSKWKLLSIFAFLLLVRYLMLQFKIPGQLYSLPFFEPAYFAFSYTFPSLGDFLINSLFILLSIRILFYIIRPGKLSRALKRSSIFYRYLTSIVSVVSLLAFFSYILFLFETIVIHSSIPLEVHKILELDCLSLVAYFICFILLITLVIFSSKIVFILKHILNTKSFIIVLCALILAYGATSFALNSDIYSKAFFYLVPFLLILIYFPGSQQRRHYSYYILLIVIGSAYLTISINKTIKQKDQDKSGILISRLINERDKVADHLLISLSENIKSDDTLKNEVMEYGSPDLQKIRGLLVKKYFNGYFSKYNLVVDIYQSYPENERLKNLNESNHPITEIKRKNGSLIENSDFYYIEKNTGEYSYHGIFDFFKDSVGHNYTLSIILESRLFDQEAGYPDLLIAGSNNSKNILSGYSYAKYNDGQLMTHSGNFPYDLSDKIFRNTPIGFSSITIENFEHHIYHSEKNLVVLSKPIVKRFDLVIAFSYLFVFFNLLLFISLTIYSLSSVRKRILISFENKLLVTMLFILILSFAMVTAGTVYYNTNQYQEKHYANLNEKIESVHKSFGLEIEKQNKLDSSDFQIKKISLDKILMQLSNINNTDINLYDFSGKLIATSRPEIFDKGIIGMQMEPMAYKEMKIDEKTRYIQDEHIGLLEYSSAYALARLTKARNQYFINLPYFTKQAELSQETSNLVVAIINLFVVLFIIVALVSFIMANKITQPLRMLQNKFRNIELGKESEQIIYEKKDEVGALVKEYNRMVVKLAESIELLARTERESAWREMAKQIAHEIKNPLTPMKLSVQFLQRSWNDKDSTFERKLQKCTQTLIDQINTLSNIASEFSTFAKMPVPKPELVNLVTTIENIFTLFSNTENLKMTTNIDRYDQLLIIADHEHISRALTNLVKNGIQAVPSEKEAFISIMAEETGDKIVIRITDNGSGISEDQKNKLFIPNFTTKSSGMGMGLPIVKDIVEASKGKIWFETDPGKGTTFIVEFPSASEEETMNLDEIKTEN